MSHDTPQPQQPTDRSHDAPSPCHEGGQELFPERNHYFTGKYMTARDFRDEQRYFLSHHRWHQWALHGWGIVWGLTIELSGEQPDNPCVTIRPGMALDCHGRELVLPCPVHFAVSDLGLCVAAPGTPANLPDSFLLGLKFAVQERECVPLLLNDEECRSGRKGWNRLREFAAIGYEPYCA